MHRGYGVNRPAVPLHSVTCAGIKRSGLRPGRALWMHLNMTGLTDWRSLTNNWIGKPGRVNGGSSPSCVRASHVSGVAWSGTARGLAVTDPTGREWKVRLQRHTVSTRGGSAAQLAFIGTFSAGSPLYLVESPVTRHLPGTRGATSGPPLPAARFPRASFATTSFSETLQILRLTPYKHLTTLD